ncbi:unnamed protein product [Rhizophagus irregularis]|nr:unnamed protein product [Rhizophagus irregularis]CAB4419600.1 unnamed protein product [Rhizophagus irregularis]
MRIFVRPEYFLGTSCETHMVDLMTTIKEEDFHEFTHHENTHLGNKDGQIIIFDEELAHENFKHAREHPRDLWNRDPINGQPVVTTYVDD